VQAGLQFLLNRQRDIQGQRLQHLHQHIADLFDGRAWHDLARRSAVLNAVALAAVIRSQNLLPRVIADGHPLATETADREPLQQSWAFTRWMAALAAVGCRVLAQDLEVALVLLPGDVTWVCFGQNDLPFLKG